jgi:hypothetical protein
VKKVFLIPLSLLATAGVGCAVLRVIGWNAYAFEMALAAGAILVATAIGVAPILWFRQSSVANIAQASLVGTVVQMFAGFTIGAGIWYLGGALNRTPFLYWLLVMYWISLTALVAVIIDLLRHTAPRATQTPPKQA